MSGMTVSKALRQLVGFFLILGFSMLLPHSTAPTTLENILARGVLRVSTVEGSTTFYRDAKGPNGFQYILAKEFAESLGVDLEINVMSSLAALTVTLGGPKADFIATGMAVTPAREKLFRFSIPFGHVTQKLLYRIGTKRPYRLEDLPQDSRLVVLSDSAHAEFLRIAQKDHPGLHWEEIGNTDALELMEMVHNGTIDFTIVDSDAYAVDRSLYPKARAAFNLTEPQPLAWAFPNYGDQSLVDAANKFLEAYQSSGKMARLRRQLFSHTENFSIGGSQLLLRRITTRLPKFKDQFIEVANRHDIDWHLLAAIAYQESHWNSKATSPTGVRGLMMLTQATAKEMGVKDRLDPIQSLEGGVKYFLNTKRRIPNDIYEPDRTWMALAAYNVGRGHLEDARILTERAGKNPHLWEDVKEFLPLLQQKKYYSTLKYGYARGNEPVQYVQNIRHYQNILRWNTLEMQRREQREQQLKIPSSSDWSHNALRPL